MVRPKERSALPAIAGSETFPGDAGNPEVRIGDWEFVAGPFNAGTFWPNLLDRPAGNFQKINVPDCE